MQQNESLIWEGHPSQWTNFGLYCLCALFGLLVVPLVLAAAQWYSADRLFFLSGAFFWLLAPSILAGWRSLRSRSFM